MTNARPLDMSSSRAPPDDNGLARFANDPIISLPNCSCFDAP